MKMKKMMNNQIEIKELKTKNYYIQKNLIIIFLKYIKPSPKIKLKRKK